MANLEVFLITSLIIFIASAVQGAVGFGFVLIVAPLLTIFLPLKILVPTFILFGLVVNTMIIFSVKQHISLKEIWVLIVMGIIGIPIGVYGLNNLDPESLKFIIGIVILLTSLAMYKGFKLNLKNKSLSFSFAGFISGVLNGSISMSGPPIVLFLANEGYDKNKFRANTNAYFIITNVITIITLAFNGYITADVLQFAGSNLIILILGTISGIYISKKINEQTFKKVILILLIATGIVTSINALI